MRKVEKEMASLTEDEIKFLLSGIHLIPVTRTETKEGDVHLLMPEAFGWRSWMNSLCLYYELKCLKTSS